MNHGEKFNIISHLIGAVCALIGLVILVVTASLQGDPWKITSLSIYGTSLLLVYLNSTLYHTFQGSTKATFRILDHLSIYLLIAGTYSPLTLVSIRGVWGWILFGIIWGLALVGFALEVFPKMRKRILTVAVSVTMGWLIVIAFQPLSKALPFTGLMLLVVGGVIYTAGIFFYLSKDRISHSHGIWHLFVLFGSLSHYLMVFLYIL